MILNIRKKNGLGSLGVLPHAVYAKMAKDQYTLMPRMASKIISLVCLAPSISGKCCVKFLSSTIIKSYTTLAPSLLDTFVSSEVRIPRVQDLNVLRCDNLAEDSQAGQIFIISKFFPISVFNVSKPVVFVESVRAILVRNEIFSPSPFSPCSRSNRIKCSNK